MTISRQQWASDSDTGTTLTIVLSSSPKDRNVLVLVSAADADHGILSISQDGASWERVEEPGAGSFVADIASSTPNVRVQIWAAFDIESAGAQIDITYAASGDHVAIAAEYAGDVSRQTDPMPVDRGISAFGSTPSSTLGTIDTTAGQTTREVEEIWIGAAAGNYDLTYQDPLDGFSIVGSVAQGTSVSIALLDQITSSTATLRMRVDHQAVAPAVEWVGIAVAFRGSTQQIFDGQDEPVPGPTIVENLQHSLQARGRLVEQFKSRDEIA